MGGIYLAGEGAAESVPTAVRWHYHPIAVERGAAPAAAFTGRDEEARVFAAVALADKLDTLAGYFGLGESPTGSRDPYGLRRAGQGAVRAVLDFWRPKAGEKAPDLGALRGCRRRGLPAAEAARRMRRHGDVQAFLLDRLEYVLSARGYASDEVGARCVHAPGLPALADPVRGLRRVEALQRVRREMPEDFAGLAEAFKRAKNIVAQAEAGASVDPALFEAEAERALHAATSRLQQGQGSYEDRLRGLASLRAPVGALLRRRARNGRGPARAAEPALATSADALALLPDRGHFQTRRDIVTQYVYFFGGGKADGNRDMKDTLGGKGAGLAEMTNAGVPVPPGFTISTEACNAYYASGGKLPAEVDQQMDAALAKLEALAGQEARRRLRPAAGLGAQRLEVLDAGHDGHDPQPGHERPLGRGLEGQDRQPALRQGQLPPLHPDVRQRRARDREGEVRARALRGQEEVQGEDRRRARREGARRGDRALQGGGAEGDRTIPSRRTRASSSWARATPSSSPG